MSISSKAERRFLSHEDWEVVRQTHHPEIYQQSRDDLDNLRKRLRTLRSRERTKLRQTEREVRGKADPRGGSFPGNVDQPRRRKQIFAGALKRVNAEVGRLRKIEAQHALTQAARRALAMRTSGESFLPPNSDMAHSGMRAKPSDRRRKHVTGRRIGSVSQANKNAQARRDRLDAE
ncbi:MAG: hypothetical protein U9R77_15735 [Pseudomonadota bacterium]|uniref:hypothetical protein n=1 Tax=Sphingobium naphthae TaxID=1886786 RepID=UPI002B079069|nr:hypothetical protein [Pseudomonadota bacterium]